MDGAHRFLKRLWSYASSEADSIQSAKAAEAAGGWDDLGEAATRTRRSVHEILKQTVFDFSKNQYNTVVAGCMKILNALQQLEGADMDAARVRREGMSFVIRVLSPIAPHICHVLWRELAYGEDVLQAQWPEVDERALRRDEIELVVQVNGKLRGKIVVPADADRNASQALALQDENVQRHVTGKTLRKAILVPGKLINLVVG